MKNLVRYSLVWLLALSLTCGPIMANAMSMEQMFNAMGNTTPAGAYHGQTQSYYTGGSMNMRLPQKNYQMFSFSPPSFSAGCGGIDIFGGAFSFINSQELVNMLQNIGSAALSQSFFMAIDALSPMVGVNLKQLMDKLQKATNQSINSCEKGKELAGMMFGDSAEKMKKWSEEKAVEWYGKTNNYGDFAQSQQNTPKDKTAVAEGAIQQISENSAMGGNLVWNALALLNTNMADPTVTEFEARLIMSLVGTYILTHSRTGNRTEKLDPKQGLETTSTLENFIGDVGATTLTGFDVYQCFDGTTDGAATATASGHPNPTRNNQPHLYQCAAMEKKKVELAGGTAYKNTLDMVTKRMERIRDAIRNDTPIIDDDKKFINTVNVPVYKMLAVSTALRNGSMSDILIAENAKLIAADYSSAYIGHLLDILGQGLAKLTSEPGFDKTDQVEAIKRNAIEIRRSLAQQMQKAYASQQEKTNLANKIIAMERQLLTSIPSSLSNTMSMRRMGR